MANDFITIYEGTDLDVGAREVTEPDGRTKRHQTAVVAAGQLVLPSSPQISGVTATGDYPTNPIDVRGWGVIVVKSVFGGETDSCTIRFVLFLGDQSTVIGESADISISATSRQEGSNYLGEVVVFDNSKVGASYIKLNVVNAPSNGVSFYIGGF